MDLSQQELPITAYFLRGNKSNKVSKLANKRKLSSAADARTAPAKREKRAVVSPDVRTTAQGNAKRAKKKTGKQIKLPVLKSPIASTSSRRERVSLSDDIVILDSPPERSVAGSSSSSKVNSNTISYGIFVPGSSKGKGLTHLANTAAQSLATPPPTNPSKKRPVDITALKPLPQRTTVTAIAPRIAALPTPETTLRKLGNIHAPSGLRTFIGTTSPCRTKHVSDALSSPSLASAPLMMKFPVSMDDNLGTHSRKHSGFSNEVQAVDPDDPFTCGSRDKELHVATPVTSPVLPSKDLQYTSTYPDIIEELVPSSQSQYLLPVDATPSRKRILKPMRTRDYEPVPSSQSQEREMNMPTSPGSLLNQLSWTRVEVDLPTPHPILHVTHHNLSSRKRLHQFTLVPSPATSSVGSPSKGFSHSFLATKSSRNRASFVASPSRSPLKRTPRGVKGKISPIKKPMSVENVRPEQEDDSVTEPESEPEVLKPGQDDGSETEPESDVASVRPPAEIGKCVAQWPPATSPRASILHSSTSIKRSPYRKRQTPASSYTSSLDDLMREGAGMSVPASHGSFMLPSSAIPAVARDFFNMFQGDGSYPDDFPESLRC
ncbi:hypothetical protein K503DRAFT_799867 [Rhizopogon vinicolor AM-OR11-026]|uniref:Uncharacterized protein n=1 Tax=Rhizopogon vinicolor AM-OR11-026 TaxID=1314800 RepID=A0A1B7N2U0_9AGAM|nr:hypothetical protein K503DRAFT_799867 [Rhizopogon vinicolor AM-OR11-026]